MEAQICGGDTREEAGGKGRGQAGGTKTKTSERTDRVGGTGCGDIAAEATRQRREGGDSDG